MHFLEKGLPPLIKKIALFDCFPLKTFSAEREFIRRCIHVFKKMGIEALSVTYSDELELFNPDLVIITHEFVAKLTDHYTIGILWSPVEFYVHDEMRHASIRSWDRVIAVSDETFDFARDISFSTGRSGDVSRLDFFPSMFQIDELPDVDTNLPPLAYIGVHWDGDRHGPLLRALASRGLLAVYGPPKSWEGYGSAYHGSVSYELGAVTRALARHQAVLAIHKPEHRRAGLPSMRVFEASAAGIPVITDHIAALEKIFGDQVHFLDVLASLEDQIEEIVGHLYSITSATAKENQQARLSFRNFFNTNASLEIILKRLVDHLTPLCVGHPDRNSREIAPVTYIVRIGGRSVDLVKRAINSLLEQLVLPEEILFVQYAPVDGFSEYIASIAENEMTRFRVINAEGDGVRSVAMWAGFNAIKTDYFALLDDDDYVYRNHISHLFNIINRKPSKNRFVYSGVIRFEEGSASFVYESRFEGDIVDVVPERRQMQFFDDFSLSDFLRFQNRIQSNTWIAHKSLLSEDVREDPKLEVAEDVYFYIMISAQTRPVFSGRATAVWSWRSDSKDNSMQQVPQEVWEASGSRVVRRLKHLPLSLTTTLGEQYPAAIRWVRPNGAASESSTRRCLSVKSLPFEVHGLNPNSFLGCHGFSTPEQDGCWAVGEFFGFAILRSKSAYVMGSLIIRLLGTSLKTPIIGIEARLAGNKCLAVETMDDCISFEFLVDDSLTRKPIEMLSVWFPSYLCPREEGWSEDDRQLRFFWKGISIHDGYSASTPKKAILKSKKIDETWPGKTSFVEAEDFSKLTGAVRISTFPYLLNGAELDNLDCAFGFSNTEGEGCWAIDEKFGISFLRVDNCRVAVNVTIKIFGFALRPIDPSQITANFGSVMSSSSRVLADYIEFGFNLDESSGETEELSINFPIYLSPKDEHWSDDDRTLRFFVRSIIIYFTEIVAPVVDQVSAGGLVLPIGLGKYSAQHVAQSGALYGVSYQEPEGVWITDRDFGFEIRRPHGSSGPGTLRVALYGSLRGHNLEGVNFKIDDQEHESFQFTIEKLQILFRVGETIAPLEKFRGCLPSFERPRDIGYSDDDRTLRFFLKSVVIEFTAAKNL